MTHTICRNAPTGVHKTAGFTLIEMMVTIAVLVVLLGLAAPSFATFQRNSELTSAANTLLSSLAAARSEAMKRGRNVTVVPIDGTNWTSGWIVFVDETGFGTKGSTETELTRQPALETSLTAATEPSGLVYVMFNGSGYPRLAAGGFQASSIDFSIASGETRRIISSPAGRLRVCKPAEAGCTASAL
jgi:type IV fimbrial biogenesis protein FimT